MIYLYYVLVLLNIYFGMIVGGTLGRYMFTGDVAVKLSALELAIMSVLITALIYVHSVVS